jgi:hypothetical protein
MSKRNLLLISFVLVLSFAYTSYGADPCMVKLDLNNTNNNDDANTHPGFTKFSIATSGSEVNGVVIDLGGNIDSRLRNDPNGRDFDDIYRDFVFGISPSGVTVTLWGLGVDRECDITLWAYDHFSIPTRHAEWWGTWGDVCDVNYMFITDHNGGDVENGGSLDNWPEGDGSTNWVGTAKADYLGRITLTSTRGAESPEGQPFAFVNALMVEPQGTFVATNYAHRPQPVDGTEAVAVDTVAKWRKGGLSEKRDVYLGTDFDDVNDANRTDPRGVLVSQDQDPNTFNLTGHIEVGHTYYWRVDEVNTIPGPNSFWKGEVWSFSTFTVGQPIAWWKLDEGTGGIAYDSSGNNYNATVYGNPVWRTSGSPYGGSGYLDFDGNGDYTDANYIDGGDINLPGEYTVTLWFKSEGDGLEANRDIFSAVGINDGHGILLELRGSESNGKIRYVHRSPVRQTGTFNEEIKTPLGYNDNQWHHLAVMRKTSAPAGRYIYIDGAQVASNTDTRDGFDLPLRIMFSVLRPGLLQRYWDGGIDDVRIFDRALDEDEILEVMRSIIASGANPPNGAIGIGKTPTLSWLPGLYAASVNGHKVYFDLDEEKVEERSGCQVDGVVTTDPCYGPIGPLGVGQTYYWAIDEVNAATAPYIWAGDVWSFTATPYTIVDNFNRVYSESSSVPPYRLRDTWKDHYTQSAPVTRAELLDTADPNHDGPRAMQYNYLNAGSPYYSEARATIGNDIKQLDIDPDWLGIGAQALVLWFYGTATNDANHPMYVTLTDSGNVSGTVEYAGDMNDIREPEWHEWTIALQDFVDDNNVTLSNIKKIIIGIGDKTPGASNGIVYFDDIQLWVSKCILLERDPDFALVDFAPVGYSASGDCIVDDQELTMLIDGWLAEDGTAATQNPSEVNLVAYYPLDEGAGVNTADVVGDHNGILTGDVSWITPGLIGSAAIHVPYVEAGGSMVDINTWNPVGNWNPDTNTGGLTLAVWAKWAGPTGVEQGMICKRDLAWDVNGLMFGLVITDWPAYPPLQFALRGTTTVAVTPTMNNYLGKWTHFAATYPHPSGDPCDPNLFARLYINGREVASGAYTFGPNSVASMAIGKTTGKNGDVAQNQTFNGDLDEVRIYNRALTAAEVAYIADLTPGDGELHIPVPSFAELYSEEPEGQRRVNFKDFAMVAGRWLTEDLYP